MACHGVKYAQLGIPFSTHFRPHGKRFSSEISKCYRDKHTPKQGINQDKKHWLSNKISKLEFPDGN
jgi:dipeptidase